MAVAAKQRRVALELWGELKEAVARHRLLTFASAVSFRALVALVPLTLLGLGVLGALGQASVWSKSIAPTIEPHVTQPVFHAIDYSAKKILASDKGSLIALATALVVWHMSAAVATVMETLNAIHDVKDERPWWRKLLVAVGLAVAIVLCIIGAVLVVTVAPKAGSGAVHFVLGVGRWLVAAALLGIAIGALVRYAPAEHPRPRWASAGSIAIVGAWIVLSLVFRVWVSDVSNFKTGIGFLTAFLVLGAYLYLSVLVFVLGVQLDELFRKREEGG
ncbi:MAG TPA: YihY/virulence factor BrkB family protein [Gaiellaceae bacterium]|jgi:membrane protein|nr:YihY/virulence factor BrkB family protein [Gaiellaceae bacterium]